MDAWCDWNYDVGTFAEVNSTSPEVASAKLVPAPRGTFLMARAGAGDSTENATVFLRSPRYSATESPKCRLAIKARLLDARIAAFVVLLNGSDARPLSVDRLESQSEPPWDTFQADVGLRREKFQIVVQLSLGADSSHAVVKQIYYENCVSSAEPACDFEEGLCQWTKSDKNRPNFDWQRTSGETKPKGNSFPLIDRTYGNSSGFYLYVSQRNDVLGYRADLVGPILPGPTTSACKISFYFTVRGFGDHPPSLQVSHTDIDSGNGSVLASLSKSKSWSEALVSIPRGSKRYRLTLTVRSGLQGGGVVAIDNIRLSPWCFEGPKVLQQYMTYQGLRTLQKNAGDQSTYRFTTCGAFGRNGPALSNCDATYRGTGSNVALRGDADVPPGFQVWTVPITDTYVLNAVGARGGLGANSMQQQLLAAEQLQQEPPVGEQHDPYLGILSNRWADRATAYANLTRGDLLYISVGQAGRPACQTATGKQPAADAQLMCSTSKDGGGGGGGGATFVFLQRRGSDNISLLMVAAGGGGLGRELPPTDFNVSQAYSCGGQAGGGGSSPAPCLTKQQQQRPGNGKLAVPEGMELPNTWLRKSWRADLAGGWGCSDRQRRQPGNGSAAAAASQDSAVGGFGGGGGGCRAGGGGGGYPGGLASPYNDHRAPGLAGSSYINAALAALIFVEKNEDGRTSLDGAFELFRKPPPCPCEDVCNWLDLNFTSYRCMCSADSWKLAEDGRRCVPATGPPEVVVGMVMQDEAGRGKLSFVEIAIITVSLATAAVVVACVIACRSVRRQWKPKKKGGMRTLINDPTLTSLQHPPETLVNSLSPNLLYEFTCFSNFGNLPQISRDNLLLVKALGQGAFGEVFEGILSLGDRWDSKSVSVAVKTSSAVLSAEQAEVDFLMEALIVSKFNHPNIVKFLGVCWDSCPRYIVLELLAGGDLRSFLREQRPAEVQQTSKLTVGDMVKLSLDVAYACHHLEQNHFIHRDIAARNCLLTESGPGRVAKIADFGMARDIYRADYYRKGGRALLPVKWMPPEAFMDGVFTTKTDVWSFGVLLWEIFSMGYMPYPGVSNREVVEFVMRGGRMEPPRHAPDSIQNLMKLCWLQHSDKRPTFASAVQVLERCLEDAASVPPRSIAVEDLAPYGGGGCKAGQDFAAAAAAGLSPDDDAAAVATIAAAAAAASGQRRESSVRFSGTTLSSSDDGDNGMLEAIDSPGAASCEPLLGAAQLLFDSFRLAAPPGPLPAPPSPPPDANA